MEGGGITPFVGNPFARINCFNIIILGGLIDIAHHKNNAKRAFEENLEFERAVKVIIFFVYFFKL